MTNQYFNLSINFNLSEFLFKPGKLITWIIPIVKQEKVLIVACFSVYSYDVNFVVYISNTSAELLLVEIIAFELF
jgi:hypothetical protein